MHEPDRKGDAEFRDHKEPDGSAASERAGAPQLPENNDLDSAPDGVDLYHYPAQLAPEEQQLRAENLRMMLNASQQRQEAQRRRRPEVISSGAEVKARNVTVPVARGKVIDTDYIKGRALVEPHEGGDAQWIAFSDLVPLDP